MRLIMQTPTLPPDELAKELDVISAAANENGTLGRMIQEKRQDDVCVEG